MASCARASRFDASFNAVWIRGDLQGTPLLEMAVDDFVLPVLTGARTHFSHRHRGSAPHDQGRAWRDPRRALSASTVGLSGRDRVYHRTGGFGSACAAIEDLSRALAGEVGPRGVRVVCLRSIAIPRGLGHRFPPTLREHMEQGSALRRLPTLRELADAAVMMASDRASAMTGTIANLTCGSIMDPHSAAHALSRETPSTRRCSRTGGGARSRRRRRSPTSGTSPSAWRTIASSADGAPKCAPPRPVQLT